MKELFRIGNISIYLFGVAVAAGMITGIFVMLKEAGRKGLNKDNVLNLSLYTLIAAIIGARLYYILVFNLGFYIKNPLEIFLVNSGGLSIQGGLIGGILFAAWYSRKKSIPFLKAADTFAPGIVIGQAVGRIGCDVYGVPMKTIYPWGVNVGAQILHPAQMYEMILDLILFTLIWRSRGKSKYDGQLFIKYIVGFSINRAIVEFFRVNPTVIGPFTVAHATSFAIIIIALIGDRIIKNRSNAGNGYMEVNSIKTPFYQYIMIVLMGAAGMLIYYSIN